LSVKELQYQKYQGKNGSSEYSIKLGDEAESQSDYLRGAIQRDSERLKVDIVLRQPHRLVNDSPNDDRSDLPLKNYSIEKDNSIFGAQ